MTGFMLGLALGYSAATLLPAGFAHLRRHSAFAALITAHGVVGPRVAPVLAAVVGVAELVVGIAALLVVGSGVVGGPGWPVPLGAVLAGAVLAGIGFLGYLRLLARRPDTGVGCGCNPLSGPRSGPITTVALLPGAGLVALPSIALLSLALASVALEGGAQLATAVSSSMMIFGVAWGTTLAVAIALLPASAPEPDAATSVAR